ncbi:MAG: sigma-70 family RNA polymerase sigma factor [Chitinophagales bacterium]
MNPKNIIEGFVTNDKEVILHYYKKLFAQIKGIVMKNGGDEDDVRDTIWKAFHAFKVQCQKKSTPPNNIEAYIVQIARFLWYKELKKKKNEQMIHQYYNELEENQQFEESIEITLVETDRQEVALQFQQHLNNLSIYCQQIIRLRYQYELPHTDIAARFGISEVVSRKRLSRCLKDLARFIESKGLTEHIANHFPSVYKYIKKHII